MVIVSPVAFLQVTNMINTNVEEFKSFYQALTQDEPDYEPFLFPVRANSKDPFIEKGKSWKDQQVTYERALELLEKGYNIGIAATDYDRLCIVDVDDMDIVGDFKPTLTDISRKRIGRHAYYFTDDKPTDDVFRDSAKRNIPLNDAGEVRANWQYVVAPGSFVPCDDEELSRIPEDDLDNAGRYTVLDHRKPESITFEELPQVYKQKIYDDRQARIDIEAKKAFKKDKPTGKNEKNHSALWDLDINDIVPGHYRKTDRFEFSELHGSKTGSNMSISKGLLHCWRHLVSHNALTALATMAGVETCDRAGYSHNSGVPSYLDFQDGETVYEIWKYAKDHNYIPESDPIPTSALVFYALNNNYCNKDDVIDGWKLPVSVYNQIIEDADFETGRKPIQEREPEKKQEEFNFDDIYNAIDSVTIPEKRADRTTLAIRLFDAYCEPNKTLIEDIIMDEMAKDWEFNKSKAEDIAKEVVKRHKEREKEQKQKEAEFNKPESVDAEGCLHIVTDENPVFITRETLEYYWYSNGYFKRLGQRKNALPIREKIRRGYIEITGEQPPTELIESTLTLMQDTLYVEKTNLTPNKDKICLKNGVYDLNKKKLLPHDPEYKFRAQIPVKYNPHARCPEIMAFFDSMVDRDIISREDVQGLIEWFGYCLVPDNKFQKAVFMIGEKGSGKTTVTNLFNDFIGIENISGESLQKLEEDRFSVARIEDKLANTCPDISSKTIYDSQIFKAITGGDRLRGERKGIDAFEFQNTARLMFAANEPPHIHKSRDAFFRRVLSVTFKKTIPEKERDKDLIERITTEEELSGLLNVALQAREELYNRGGFINEKTLEETEREYSALSEPVVLFADECLVEGDYTSKHDVYSFYRDVWCTVHGLKPEKEQTFKKQLRHFVGIEEASRYDDDGNRRPRGYATDLIGHQEFVEMIQAKHGSHPTSDQLTTNL